MKTIQIHIYNSDPDIEYELVVHRTDKTDPRKDYENVFNSVVKCVITGTDVTQADLLSSSRKREIVDSRRMIVAAMTAISEIPQIPLSKMLGYKDHTSVYHHLSVHKNLMKTDPEYAHRYRTILRMSEAII